MREAQHSLEVPQSDDGTQLSPGRVCSLVGARERKGKMLLPGGSSPTNERCTWAASCLKEEARLGLLEAMHPFLGLELRSLHLGAWQQDAGSCGQAGGEPSTFRSGSQWLSYYYFFFFWSYLEQFTEII